LDTKDGPDTTGDTRQESGGGTDDGVSLGVLLLDYTGLTASVLAAVNALGQAESLSQAAFVFVVVGRRHLEKERVEEEE
jgi:hypothetical protein